MNRFILIAIALFTTTSAHALSLVARHETNGMVTQVREGLASAEYALMASA